MPHAILNEDWSEYDDRKLRDNRDRSKFSCEEEWEVNYLVHKLSKHYPSKATTTIRSAITSSCGEVGVPRARAGFVEHVIKKLA